MGNKMSNPMSNESLDRVQVIITEVMANFTTEFAVHYKDAVVDSAKNKNPEIERETKGLMLPNLPIPDYALKCGVMYKKGDVNKGWKTRYFCARNESDNFAIDYYETESLAKKKGTILCCGHRTEEFSPEEVELHGKYGIKLSPEDDNRVWWLRCENEDEKADWLKILMNACQKSVPPVHPDPAVVAAFQATYKALRWQYGYHGWYRSSYTEVEHLSRLCSDLVSKEVLHKSFADFPESSQKVATVKLVQKSVDAAISAAANKAWMSALSSCLEKRGSVEAQVRAVMDRLSAEEGALEGNITAMTKEVVEPFLRKCRQRVCMAVLRSCEHPVTNAFVTSVHGFHDYMTELIKEGSFQKDVFHSNIILSHRSVEEWWSGPLEDTNQVCWAMYTNDLTDIASFFVAGYSAYTLYSEVLDSNRRLMHLALSLFSKKAVEASYRDLTTVLKDVLLCVINDAKLYLKSVLHYILIGFLRSPYDSDIIGPCLELVAPIQKVIDDSSPPLPDLLLLPALAERVLWKLLHVEVGEMVEATHADNCAEIDTTRDLLGP